MTEPRRLRGHKGTATCCIASRDRPGVVATAGEDGCICLFDMRCKDAQHIVEVAQEPITSLCFKSGNEDIMYVSSGNEVKCFDVHNMASMCTPFKSYNYNKDEINQIACNSKAAFLASTDDGGDVKVLSVQFIPWRPWEVITGGLDSKLVMWDFSKGRPVKIVDFGLHDIKKGSSGAKFYNPAFVHAIAVPDVDMLEKSDKICVVARGDGVVDVINIESELAAIRSKICTKARKGSPSTSKGGIAAAGTEILDLARNRLHLDYSVGGHFAAVSCVTFSMFGEKGKLIISGGNDKSVKVWDCSKYHDAGQNGGNNDVLRLNIDLGKKYHPLKDTKHTLALVRAFDIKTRPEIKDWKEAKGDPLERIEELGL
ncbi:unnamed protein product [Dovyalis caffra]|uniref:Transducin/WD40 repeat-like superfamily protein n=1 Tax=Dovyalis caffra TaxID=77055 RepID=A0AAV1SIX4_9ROSI|nr:unnamed protein product [Dovyalis caffra]